VEITNFNQKKNTKCRRGRNLMKKSYELSILCGLQINLIIYNPKINKIQEYSSSAEFTHEKVQEIINAAKEPTKKVKKRKPLKRV